MSAVTADIASITRTYEQQSGVLLLVQRTRRREGGSLVLDRQVTATPGTPEPVALRPGRQRPRRGR